MLYRPSLLASLLALLIPAQAVASPSANPDHSASCWAAGEFNPKVTPETQAVRITGEVTINGKIDEPAWTDARRVGGFTEVQPGDQTRPDACTEVLVGYDDAHLYVAFRAHDPTPSTIRASLRNRDEIFGDDWVGIIVDPYGDAAKAYEIFANPYGIQGDLLMSSTNGEDVGFDLMYRSEGQITESGFTVEMAIPFSSLRFPAEPVQDWRLTFMRTRPRSSRQQFSWAAVDRDDPCLMCQLGTLSGIEGIEPSTNLDVIPTLVGTQSADLVNPDVPAAGLNNDRVQVEPSLNLRYNFTPSLSAEATLNPDFSQVESDAARIDVNETFALSFPERRPFFQEGGDLFNTWIDVVYTRSINAPIAAAKMTGRFGRTSVAYMSAVDDKTPMLLPFEEQSATLDVGQSAANILRARRTFGENSFVGTTVTDRRYVDVGGAGSLVSADAKIQFWDNYRIETQLALSHTNEPDRPSRFDVGGVENFDRGTHTGALDGEQFAGTAAFMSFDRTARHWNWDLAYEHNSPTFRTATGFERRNDFRRLRLWQGYQFYFDDGAVIERLRPGMFVATEQNFAGVGKQTSGEIQLFARLKGQTHLWSSVDYARERFNGVLFEGLAGWNVNLNSSFSNLLRVGFNVNGGRDIFRGANPQEGRELNVNAWGTIQPVARLTIQPEASYARLRDLETDTTFFEGYVLRSKTSIQFNRELSLRLVTQYNHFSGNVDVEPLLSYQLNPFSVFHVGTTHDYDVLSTAPNRPGRPNLVQTERQFFFKFQYLFRL